MIAVNPKLIGLAFAGLFACALSLQLALTIVVAIVGPRPWDKTYAQHARDMLDGNALEKTSRNIVMSDLREMPFKRTGRELKERIAALWVRCIRRDVTGWLNSDNRELSVRVGHDEASALRLRFISSCEAKLGFQQEPPCRHWNCGTHF